MNNYTDVKDYKDYMTKRLSKSEKAHIRQYGPSAGCEHLIRIRCVKGLPKEQRPIHCVDASRDKFVYRKDGEWETDEGCIEIMKPAMAQVRTLYDISDTNTDIDDRVDSQRLLLDMDMNATKRTIKNLKKETLLKNKN